MSILSLLQSPFVICLLIVTFVIFPLPILLNYTILENIPDYALQLIGSTIFIVTFIVAYIISYISSIQECNKFKNKVSLKQAFKQAIYSVLIYYLVFFVPFLKSGFTDIGGETLFWNGIGEGFILGMSNIALTVVNFFNSKTEACKLSTEEADKAYKDMEKQLDSRETPEIVEKVTIRN